MPSSPCGRDKGEGTARPRSDGEAEGEPGDGCASPAGGGAGQMAERRITLNSVSRATQRKAR